jgi:putative acetyltransferase
MRFVEGEFDDPQIVSLLRAHVTRARAETARGSAHSLELDQLKAPDIRFWTLWDGETLLAMSALRTLTPDHAEIKSMHTAEAARRRGRRDARPNHRRGAGTEPGAAEP